MTSAKERAVEAGARAVVTGATGSDTRWYNQTEPWRECLRADAKAVLRAAFPILAEELVKWHDEQGAAERQLAIDASEAYQPEDVVQHHLLMSARHSVYALSLRARIQQMAEAL